MADWETSTAASAKCYRSGVSMVGQGRCWERKKKIKTKLTGIRESINFKNPDRSKWGVTNKCIINENRQTTDGAGR